MPRSIYLFTEAIQNFNAIKLLRDEIVTFWTPLPLSSSCKRCEPPEVGRGTSLYCNNEQCSSGKYKIKRKLRFKSNTWPWQRLRICLNSLLKQGEKSFSLLKRILHYTRCTMTESRLNDLALKALHPKRLSELSTEKIIEMFVQANPRKL